MMFQAMPRTNNILFCKIYMTKMFSYWKKEENMKKTLFSVIVFLAFSVGSIHARPQTEVQAGGLETLIRNTILLAPHYGVFDNLSFRLDGSDVTLLGQVLLPITRDEISRRVSKLLGVARVTDNIEILPLSRSDDAMRLQVYRGIFGTADLYRYALGPDPSIHIIVKNSRVTLEGAVSNEGDSRIAAIAARKVNGVLAVINNLRII